MLQGKVSEAAQKAAKLKALLATSRYVGKAYFSLPKLVTIPI